MLTALLISAFLQDPPKPATREKEVVITAKRHESDLLETPTGVTLIPREEIEKSAAHTVVDLLQGRAGLFVRKESSTPQDTTIDARGFNNGGGAGQRLLVLVDGRKVNSVTGSSVDWAAIPLQNVEKVEIIRGPAAASYGDTAVAGVINVITRRPTKEPAVALEGLGGSFHTSGSSGSYRLMEGSIGLSLFGGLEDSGGFRNNSAFTGRNATALVTFDPQSNISGWLKFGLHEDRRQRPGLLTESEIDALGRDGTVAIENVADVATRFVDLGVAWGTLGGTLTPSVSVTSDAFDSIATDANGSFSQDSESQLVQFGIKHVVKFGDGTTVVAGLDLALETADSKTFSNFPGFGFVSQEQSRYGRAISGFYSRVEHRVSPRFLVSAGLRHDQAKIDFERETLDLLAPLPPVVLEGDKGLAHTAPQASAAWFFTPETSIYISTGRTARFPNRDELVGSFGPALDLGPEKATTTELGFRTRQWKEITGSIVIFTMDVHNEIFPIPPATGSFAFPSNQNIEEVRHQGVELELESPYFDPVLLHMSLTWQKTTIEDGPSEDKEMPVAPALMATLGAVWRMESLEIGLVARYVGARYLINDLNHDFNPLDPYAVADLKASYRWKKAKFYIEATNLFDREYFDYGGYGGFPFGSRQAFNPAPGTGYFFGVVIDM